MNPETMDAGAYKDESPRQLRELVTHYPGMKSDIPFFDDEFNSIPSWKGSDESVQAKYLPRGLIYNLAAGVKTFVWLLAAGTDGNEYDDFGIIHGLTNHATDWTPRPVFYALQNTNALFSDTKFDPSIEIAVSDLPALARNTSSPFLSYGFRNRNGKAIVAYWIAAHSEPGNVFQAQQVTMSLKNTGIMHPVVIDVVSGEITPAEWKPGASDTLEMLPLKDSIVAVADEDYFDWPVLPEAPSSLKVVVSGKGATLMWDVHGGNPASIVVERRSVGASSARWEKITTLPASAKQFADSAVKKGQSVAYRVRSENSNGSSAYSNIVRVTL
jgi:hypothetical protein